MREEMKRENSKRDGFVEGGGGLGLRKGRPGAFLRNRGHTTFSGGGVGMRERWQEGEWGGGKNRFQTNKDHGSRKKE